jgi:hypothetical protein
MNLEEIHAAEKKLAALTRAFAALRIAEVELDALDAIVCAPPAEPEHGPIDHALSMVEEARAAVAIAATSLAGEILTATGDYFQGPAPELVKDLERDAGRFSLVW